MREARGAHPRSSLIQVSFLYALRTKGPQCKQATDLPVLNPFRCTFISELYFPVPFPICHIAKIAMAPTEMSRRICLVYIGIVNELIKQLMA